MRQVQQLQRCHYTNELNTVAVLAAAAASASNERHTLRGFRDAAI